MLDETIADNGLSPEVVEDCATVGAACFRVIRRHANNVVAAQGLIATKDTLADLQTGTRTGEELSSLTWQVRGITSVVFSPDGSRLAAISSGGYVAVWEFATRKQLFKLNERGNKEIMWVAFSPDGQRLVSAGRGPELGRGKATVTVWDASTGQELLSLRSENDTECVAFSPDGRWLAAVDSCRIRVWDGAPVKEAPAQDR
jgi:WD40 repeat protein